MILIGGEDISPIPQLGDGHASCSRQRAEIHVRGTPTIEAQRDLKGAAAADARHAPVLFVVDDDTPTVELVCEVARELGWHAVGFTRLEAVRSALDRNRPTLLIVDDDLPDGRGGDLARELRRDRRTRDLPLVVFTAATPRRQAEIGSWAPVVSKPFDLGQLEDVLSAAVRHRRVDPTSTRRHAG